MPSETEHPQPIPSDPEPAKPTRILKDLTKRNFWQRRMPVPLVVTVIAVCLVLAVGLAWIVSNYKITVVIERRSKLTAPTPSPTATSVAQAVSTDVASRPTATNTPTPPVLSSPTAATVEPASIMVAKTSVARSPSSLLAQANEAFQLALKAGDRQQAQAALAFLAKAEASDPVVADEIARLRSQLYYALDVLDGTIYLDTENTICWTLVTTDGRPLVYPIDLTMSNEGIYIIDSGTLYRGDLSALTPGGGQITLTAILTPAMQIGGYPVKEIVAVDATNTEDAVFVLDKSNDIYRYEISSGVWWLERPQASEYTKPDPLYLNISTYLNRLYILDPARNQIWRHPPNEYGVGFLPGTLPWLLSPGEPDVSSGIDLAIDGNIYVLWRDGTIVTLTPFEVARFSLVVADGISHVQGLEDLPVRPVAIFANVEGTSLYVTDPGRRRVVVLDRRDGSLLRQLVAPNNLDFAALHGIAEREGRLYMLAGTNLYGYDLNAGISGTVPLVGQLPVLQPLPQPDSVTLHPGDLAPNDPRLPAVLATYSFTMPIKGALLPDRSAIYPGSRRAYRYGVHQGLDLYGKDIGVEVKIGTPVYAAGDGIIVRADVAYQEMSLAEVNALLADANARHITPPETLDKLGGRQVWIDHGNGVLTKYLHLSDIAESITVTQQVHAGQLIGYVGLSGTPDGISGNTQFPHLHFEIRTGNEHQYYLGQWLTIEETRRAFERIFNVPVRPAYLDFRQKSEGNQ